MEESGKQPDLTAFSFDGLSNDIDHSDFPDVLHGMAGFHKPHDHSSTMDYNHSEPLQNPKKDAPPASTTTKHKKFTTASSSTSTGSTIPKPMTVAEKRAWEKLIAIAGNRKDGAVIASKIQQIQNYRNLFPNLAIEKINAETITLQQLDIILEGIENQLSQPHVRETGKFQFVLLCKAFQNVNKYFKLGLKTENLMTVADIRYKYIEPDWLELLCKYNCLINSKPELRFMHKFWQTLDLTRQVDEGKINIKRKLHEMPAMPEFNDL